MLLSSGREEKTQVQCFRGKLITQVSSVWMYIYHVNRKVYKNKQTNKSNTTTTKNFKATNESLFKANMFTVYEICVNFQPFFSEELREATTLKSSSVLVTHVGKQSPALLYQLAAQNSPWQMDSN